MNHFAAFVLEASLCFLINFCLFALSVYQLYYDLVRHERLRALIVSHYLNLGACGLALVNHVDPQGGLGLYGEAFILFITNVRVLLILASASAIASGFLSSYQLMTQGPQLPKQQMYEFIVQAALNVLGIVLCIALFASRSAWLAIAVKIYISAFSCLQGLNVFRSTLKVRKCLVEEHTRTAKYENGIKKLNRLLIFVCVLVVIGNFSILYVVPSDVAAAHREAFLPEETPIVFNTTHIMSDCVTLACLAAILSGSWKVSPIVQNPKTNPSSTDSHSIEPKKTNRSSTISRPAKSNSSPGASGQSSPDASVTTKQPVSPELSVVVELSKIEINLNNDPKSKTPTQEQRILAENEIGSSMNSTPEAESPPITASPRVSLDGYQKLTID